MGYINSEPDICIRFEISCSQSKLIDLITAISDVVLYPDCLLYPDGAFCSGYKHSIDLLFSFRNELQDLLDSVQENLGEF